MALGSNREYVMVTAIETTLHKLVGLPLWDAGRAATMLWLQFGERVHAPIARDPERTVGTYALHLQCPWRVSTDRGVLVGWCDMFVPSDSNDRSFDPGVPGNALADDRLREWISGVSPADLVVNSVSGDPCGGFTLRTAAAYLIETFPCSAADSDSPEEQWRLLQPGTDLSHFVVLNSGIETE